jgi:hypothetical protein
LWHIDLVTLNFTLKKKIEKAHEKDINFLSWNYDETKLVTVSDDKKMIIWDVTNNLE